jgi:predicted TIM-barrel fold metal-dependent hydrolase
LRLAHGRNFSILVDGLAGPFDGLGGLAERVGSERLLFGTRTPILYAEAARLMIEQSTISEEEKANIFGANAAALLGLAS